MIISAGKVIGLGLTSICLLDFDVHEVSSGWMQGIEKYQR